MNWKLYFDHQVTRITHLQNGSKDMAELEKVARDYLEFWGIDLDSSCYGSYTTDSEGKIIRRVWTWATVDYYKLLKDYKGKVCHIMSSATVIERPFTFAQNGHKIVVHLKAEIPPMVQKALREGGVIVTKHVPADDYDTVECPVEAGPTVEGDLTLVAGGSNEVVADPEVPAGSPVTLEHVERSESPTQELLQRIQAVKDGDSATFETDQTQEVRHE